MSDCKEVSLLSSLKDAIDELHTIFHSLNEHKFNKELPEPAITIQMRGKRNALGWCSIEPIWTNEDESDKRREINICAENANLSIIQIVEIMLHEMVHYYCDLQGIKTTSRNGTFHNKHYKEYAERFGLKVEKTDKYGYADTKLNSDTLNLVKELNFNQEAFTLYRFTDGKVNKKKGSIKHICPLCHCVARTTKEIPLICGSCEADMEIENEDDED
jgi:hypothetical protein